MEDLTSARILARFKSETGELVGSPFDLPLDTSPEKLQLVCHAILQQVKVYFNCKGPVGKLKN